MLKKNKERKYREKTAEKSFIIYNSSMSFFFGLETTEDPGNGALYFKV